MATVTGTLRDIGLNPMSGLRARLVFTPDSVATSGATLFATQSVYADVGSGGAFTADLQPSLQTNPYSPLRMAIEWQDSAGNYTRTDFPDFHIVVPEAGGRIADMVALVSPSKIVTKGDKGDNGNMVQQAAIDSLRDADASHVRSLTSLAQTSQAHTEQLSGLRATDAVHGRDIGGLKETAWSQGEQLSAQRGLIDRNAHIAHAYTDARTQEITNILDTSNVGMDTDNTPFIHFGSTTVKVLQDTDGAPYYKARS